MKRTRVQELLLRLDALTRALTIVLRMPENAETSVLYSAIDMEKRAVELEIARLAERADRRRVRKNRAPKAKVTVKKAKGKVTAIRAVATRPHDEIALRGRS